MNSFFMKCNKSRRLLGAILLFVLLDFTVLLFNYRIAYQVSSDAVSVNLAGRQRMLSQRMTKSLLQLRYADAAGQEAAETEFRESMRSFDLTLRAFEQGGIVNGSDDRPARLQQITSIASRELVEQAQLLWHPIQTEVLPFAAGRLPAPKIELARRLMLQNNLHLLDLMNRLTSNLEQDSRNNADRLRRVQTLIFLFALLNFVIIVRSFHLLARRATQTSEHFGELAMRDPLTGLFNRRQFNIAMKRETSAASRREGGFALLLIDLDDFKPVNDLHGHAAGDAVLRIVADRLTTQARSHDTVARFGGDEFVLICPDLCDQQSTSDLCERLLRALNEPVVLETAHVHVGASIGIAFYPDDSTEPKDLIHAADHAMYSAKKAGRSGWSFADSNEFRDAT